MEAHARHGRTQRPHRSPVVGERVEKEGSEAGLVGGGQQTGNGERWDQQQNADRVVRCGAV